MASVSKNGGVPNIISFIKLMRVKHYVKNLLIFVPLIFSKKLFGFPLLINLICGFISFSLLASVVYIINDIRDAEKDRAHPTKCKRPIASGKIKKKPAVISAIVIFITSLAALSIASPVTPAFAAAIPASCASRTVS